MNPPRLSHLALALLGGFVLLSHARATDSAPPSPNSPFGSAISFYDSGWHQYNAGNTIVFDHNLGGNVDNYVVDLTARDDFASKPHGAAVGRDHTDFSTAVGTWWHELDATSVWVSRGAYDSMVSSLPAGEIRLRIWRLR